MGLTRRGTQIRNFNHNRAPGQARDRAIADWPEGRRSEHERVKETEDTDECMESGNEISRRGAGARREQKYKDRLLWFLFAGIRCIRGPVFFTAGTAVHLFCFSQRSAARRESLGTM